jgi:hypothetical protein
MREIVDDQPSEDSDDENKQVYLNFSLNFAEMKFIALIAIVIAIKMEKNPFLKS